MVKWLVKLGLKCVSYDTLVECIASAIAYLIAYARKNSSQEGWQKAKLAIKQTKNWINLFDEVYEDDTLTPEEEKRIQDEIAKCTTTKTIYNLLNGREAPKKEI